MKKRPGLPEYHKKQKATALAQTGGNREQTLLRVQDVLEELNGAGAGPLAARGGKAARLYLQATEELATLEINHSYYELERIRLELEELAAKEAGSTGVTSKFGPRRRGTGAGEDRRLKIAPLKNWRMKKAPRKIYYWRMVPKKNGPWAGFISWRNAAATRKKLAELTSPSPGTGEETGPTGGREKRPWRFQVESGDEEKARINRAVKERKKEELRRQEERILGDPPAPGGEENPPLPAPAGCNPLQTRDQHD